MTLREWRMANHKAGHGLWLPSVCDAKCPVCFLENNLADLKRETHPDSIRYQPCSGTAYTEHDAIFPVEHGTRCRGHKRWSSPLPTPSMPVVAGSHIGVEVKVKEEYL